MTTPTPEANTTPSDVGGGDVTALAEALGRINRPNLGGGARDAETRGWIEFAAALASLIAAREAAAEQRGRQAALREAADEPMPLVFSSGAVMRRWLHELADANERLATCPDPNCETCRATKECWSCTRCAAILGERADRQAHT